MVVRNCPGGSVVSFLFAFLHPWCLKACHTCEISPWWTPYIGSSEVNSSSQVSLSLFLLRIMHHVHEKHTRYTVLLFLGVQYLAKLFITLLLFLLLPSHLMVYYITVCNLNVVFSYNVEIMFRGSVTWYFSTVPGNCLIVYYKG